MKKLLLVLIFLCLLVFSASAHSGGTDGDGGHYDHIDGGYHYHHGKSAHQHPGGVCPYDENKTAKEDTARSKSDPILITTLIILIVWTIIAFNVKSLQRTCLASVFVSHVIFISSGITEEYESFLFLTFVWVIGSIIYANKKQKKENENKKAESKTPNVIYDNYIIRQAMNRVSYDKNNKKSFENAYDTVTKINKNVVLNIEGTEITAEKYMEALDERLPNNLAELKDKIFFDDGGIKKCFIEVSPRFKNLKDSDITNPMRYMVHAIERKIEWLTQQEEE